LGLSFVVLALTTGCRKKDEIRQYRVPSQLAIERANSGEKAPDKVGKSDADPSKAGGGMFRPPVTDHPPVAPPRVALSYDVPEGWKPGRSGGMRKAAFVATDGDKQVETTVIDLPMAAGDVAANVNRWRGQLGLAPLSAAELEKEVQSIKLGEVKGRYVALFTADDVKPGRAILGVLAAASGKVWFITLKGDAELARREQERFEAFVRSVRFDAPKETGDG